MRQKRKTDIKKGVWYCGVLLLLPAMFFMVAGCNNVDQLELAGTLERRTLEISAPISEIIVDLPVKVGDHLSKDTIIVQLDTQVVAAELRAHEAGLAAAKALEKESSGEFSRQKRLYKERVATMRAYDAARRQIEEARALVAEKEARITQAKKRLEDLTIRSRATGIIDQLPFEVGERVPAGGVVAVVIADDKPWVRVRLPARAVARVSIKQEVGVKIAGLDKWFKGEIEHISREPEFTPHYALTETESAHLVFETKVRLLDATENMPPGIPAWVSLSMQAK
ncbi:MAG: efflux RND transporter periplasmic adaptor subunit [bacterium]|nr:efflux RND transporter periplasmic adaptor subunit [bacterium]